jgi:hypothetical protein
MVMVKRAVRMASRLMMNAMMEAGVSCRGGGL